VMYNLYVKIESYQLILLLAFFGVFFEVSLIVCLLEVRQDLQWTNILGFLIQVQQFFALGGKRANWIDKIESQKVRIRELLKERINTFIGLSSIYCLELIPLVLGLNITRDFLSICFLG